MSVTGVRKVKKGGYMGPIGIGVAGVASVDQPHFSVVKMGSNFWVEKTRDSLIPVSGKTIAKKLAGKLNVVIRKTLKKPAAHKMRQGGGEPRDTALSVRSRKSCNVFFRKRDAS